MHSDLTQQERDEVMYLFRSAQTDILVATDIVARGIDIDDITLVINFDVPHDAEDYVHRIGRTARAGAGGSAITLVSEKDQLEFMKIERFLGKEVERMTIPESLGKGPAYNPKAQDNRSNKGKRGSKGNKGGRNKMNKNGHSKPRHKKNHDKPKPQQTETQKKESK
jgi:superfamily II DNA/RNA helicase